MSETVDVKLYIHMRDPKRAPRAIRVSKDGVYRDDEQLNPFLPTSQIEYLEDPAGRGPVLIRMPYWLASKRGLL